MRVVVTRPESEARRWVDDLRQGGFEVLEFPLMAIAPVTDPAGLQAAWRELAQARAAMFVSGNAVRHFFAQRPPGTQWPAGTRAWATGPGTRNALLGAGVPAEAIDAPAASAAQFDSETLWAQVASQVGTGDRVLIVRGGDADGTSAGRDWLADQVNAAGGRAERVVSYRRGPPQPGALQLQLAVEAARPGHTWLFSSSQAVAHLRAMLPQQDWSQARAVTTHARIAQAARRAGFGVVCESRPALEAILAALESFR